jgi:hypothetical protein
MTFKFPVDINGLMTIRMCAAAPFLLASQACILYPVEMPRMGTALAAFRLGGS